MRGIGECRQRYLEEVPVAYKLLSTMNRLSQVKVTSSLPRAVDMLEGHLLYRLSHCRSGLIEHSSVVLAGVPG